MKFSILICSLNRRARYLNALKAILQPQMTDEVEVLVSIDDGQESIGSKRQRLLNSANGEYIAFVDDDDVVSSDYVKLILEGIKKKPDVIGIHLIMRTDGVLSGLTYHSLKYNTWYDEAVPGQHFRKYYRNPNHLNPVKKELALKAGFPSISMGEDRNYSAALLPYLKTEYYIESPIYFYKVRTHKEV